jgi:predicted RND superfamily exporter protein
MEMINNMKEVVFHVPDSDNVSSLAELIKASTGAIETLNKLVTQDKKSQTQLQVKHMDIQSKKVLQDSEQEHKLKISREDVLKKLIDGKDIINVDTEELPE